MPHQTYKIKTGDTRPLLVTLRDQNGPVDLDYATVKFNMRPVVTGIGSTVTAEECAVLQSGTEPNWTDKGKVTYSWEATDVDTPGLHACEWEVTWQDGTRETFPNGSDGNDYFMLEIIQDLG